MTSTHIGIIGTGKINSAVVKGLCAADIPGLDVVVSPRNSERAKSLASRFDQVRIADNNQGVSDHSDTIFIALLPRAATDILSRIVFRPDQTLFCLIPTLTLARAKELTAPAAAVHRVLPLPSVAFRFGPILYFPESIAANDLLCRIGEPFPVPDEKQLNLLWALTGLISPYYALQQALAGRVTELGADSELSRKYTTWMFETLSRLGRKSGAPLESMAEEAATPGGLNEMANEMLGKDGAYMTFVRALDAVIERFPDID